EQGRGQPGPMQQREDRSAEIVGLAGKRPKKGHMKRWKLLLTVLVGIVAISTVFGILYRPAGFEALNRIGQSTPLPSSTPMPTSTPVSKRAPPLVPVNTTSGA